MRLNVARTKVNALPQFREQHKIALTHTNQLDIFPPHYANLIKIANAKEDTDT